ncbi:histone-lysine N-methyltransferase SUV39H1-A [Eurytemora carolleeae]|uniref:histone-lysine N-methyltransferase SUV39H1-A n=1 Tax=Eurytemora carolleeae TaxID=1294199 RepID=UPI000C76664A|nr:histone-lysine N-methyltransferase SUV39H1-A [Eurytemora carolleeae]|eukprot:XP_023328199.1 histone-lysine N-methyltransferase SUV39H1-A-like [Eurytemora affinis]
METSQTKHSDPSDIQEKETSMENNLEKDIFKTKDIVEQGDDGKDDTDSLSSTESGELVKRLKRKRVEEDDEESEAKRRSEEPLVKLFIVDETNNEKEEKEDFDDDNETDKDLKQDKEEEKDAEEEVYEVESVVDYDYCKETERGLYKIKWIGWAEEHNTWEPIDNLLHCREHLVKFYYKRLQERESASAGKKRSLPMPPDPRISEDLRDLFISKYYTKPSQETLEALFQAKKKGKVTKLLSESVLRKEMENLAGLKKINMKRLEAVRVQLNLRELQTYRDNQLKQIKDWENKINDIEKDAHVSVTNDVDLDGPPTLMEYINCYKAGDGIEIPDDPRLGCECENCSSKCSCYGMNETEMAYNQNGRLRVDIGYPIYECNKRCKCPSSCRNRVVQNGRKVKLGIFRTSNGCGWGVRTLENIKKGSFVVQYVGEVITSDEAEERGKKYDADGKTYLFDLDFNLGDENPFTVDAAFYGNLSHFINHSCDPNLNIFNVYINCLDPNLPQLCLFARRNIKKGEELNFDYSQSTQSADSEDSPDSPCKTPHRAKVGESSAGRLGTPGRVGTPGQKKESSNAVVQKTECRCNAKNCRKVLF